MTERRKQKLRAPRKADRRSGFLLGTGITTFAVQYAAYYAFGIKPQGMLMWGAIGLCFVGAFGLRAIEALRLLYELQDWTKRGPDDDA